MNRDLMLDTVRNRAEPWDLIIIGGGATGAGCCLDAAARGLSVLLLEKFDFGKGTSGRSTKLVHGGVRYLEQGNISLVREALRERGILQRNAGEYVEVQEFVVPCYSVWERLYYSIGLKAYDFLSGKLSFGKSRALSLQKTKDKLPTAVDLNLKGGVSYFDGKFDDTKLLTGILTTAVDYGASVINYADVKSLSTGAGGKVGGVSFECAESGEVFSVKSRSVINAAGAFSDEIRALAAGKSEPVLKCSRGAHVVLDKEFLPSETALLIPKTNDGRVLFAIPFYGKVLVGTTDTPIGMAIPEPAATHEDIEFIISSCGRYLSRVPEKKDVCSAFAGIRPLIGVDGTKNTAQLSRGHLVETHVSGLITVTGGKWTTYRNMAEDAVNRAVENHNLDAKPCATHDLKIGKPKELDPIGLEERLSPDFEWTVADVVRALRFEMARTVEDVLARRTRILFLDAQKALELAPFVAEVAASELGKDEEWKKRQIKEFETVAKRYIVS